MIIAACIAVLAIIFVVFGITGGEKTGDNAVATSPENKITGRASAVNDSQQENPSTICEFCRQTNDTVYKNSGACKPCFA